MSVQIPSDLVIPTLWENPWSEAIENATPGTDRQIVFTQSSGAHLLKLIEERTFSFERLAWLTLWNKSFWILDSARSAFRTSAEYALDVLARVLQQAQSSISVIDPYVDGTIFTLLANVKGSVSAIQILTHQFPSDFTLEARKFQAQYQKSALEVRSTREFHDRFLVLDGKDCWHIGCSIKDAGVRAFMISEVEDQGNRDSLVQQVRESWRNASPLAI